MNIPVKEAPSSTLAFDKAYGWISKRGAYHLAMICTHDRAVINTFYSESVVTCDCADTGQGLDDAAVQKILEKR